MHFHPGFAQCFRALLAILIAALEMPYLVCSFALNPVLFPYLTQ